MKQKLTSLILLCYICTTLLLPPALADNPFDKAVFDVNILLDGQPVHYRYEDGREAEAFLLDGVTYLPVRALANMLGLNVFWHGESQTISLASPEMGEPEIPFRRTDSVNVYLNGEEMQFTYSSGFSAKAVLQNNITYLPLRAIANAFDLHVNWDEGTNTALLDTRSAMDAAQTMIRAHFNGYEGIELNLRPGNTLYVGFYYTAPYTERDFAAFTTDLVNTVLSAASQNKVPVYFIESGYRDASEQVVLYWHSFNTTGDLETSKIGDLFDKKQYVRETNLHYTEIESALADTDVPNEFTLGAGSYTVGYNLQPGTYYLYAYSGNGELYVYTKAGILKRVYYLGVNQDEHYVPDMKELTLTSGMSIQISGNLKLTFSNKHYIPNV